MANMKANTYRISRILKRLLGYGFGDSFLKSDVSSEGMRQAKEYTLDNGPIPLLHPSGERKNDRPVPNDDLQYQKELQAQKHLDSSQEPQTPGKILRLPLQKFFESDPDKS